MWWQLTGSHRKIPNLTLHDWGTSDHRDWGHRDSGRCFIKTKCFWDLRASRFANSWYPCCLLCPPLYEKARRCARDSSCVRNRQGVNYFSFFILGSCISGFVRGKLWFCIGDPTMSWKNQGKQYSILGSCHFLGCFLIFLKKKIKEAALCLLSSFRSMWNQVLLPISSYFDVHSLLAAGQSKMQEMINLFPDIAFMLI